MSAPSLRTIVATLLAMSMGGMPPAAAQPSANASAPADAGAVTTTVTSTVTTTTLVPASAAPVRPWSLVLLPDEPVTFHGMVDRDAAGMGPGNMMYPVAPGLGIVGLFVGIAVHAATVGGIRSSRETRAQTAADEVLVPYHDALAAFRLRDLEQRALSLTPAGQSSHLRALDEIPAAELAVQAAPVLSMTPDSAALVLDEAVVAREMGAAPDPAAVPLHIRVVSSPRPEADLRAAWSADNGAALKQSAATLMAASLDAALAAPRSASDAPFRTVRYALGDAERMERAQVLDESCERLVLRNLRGDLMLVPHRVGAALPAGCPAPVVPATRLVAVAAMPPASAASAASPPTSGSPTP